MMRFYKLLTAVLGSLVIACSASADVVYSNGSLNGTSQGGAQISPTQELSDSFALMDATTLTRVTLGLWTPSNALPEMLTWSIGASPFGSELGTGTASLSSTLANSYDFFDVYVSTFDLNVALAAGEYWLTLGNGSSTGGGSLGWDINFGPSLAFYRNSDDSGPAPSEYFVLEGTVNGPGPSPVPEPGSLALLGAGLACVAAARRRLPRTA